ncbi:hypothetical protein BDV23DRAFT_129685 [Aspergillus alliaceus]|uniref:Uncharacterized protein n=1 Tax=Petromyces alliaceus TaxID=209559 RepID=A0A5N7BZP1_PETAA|nr:hypothetical protein BDV23DRAFT_129685 [Aspergillus alliaceus]
MSVSTFFLFLQCPACAPIDTTKPDSNGMPSPFFVNILLLLALLNGYALCRRGGGGDSDSDGGRGDSTLGTLRCATSNSLVTTTYVFPGNAWN